MAILATRVTRAEARYWDGVATAWRQDAPQALWRRYGDALASALFAHWLPAAPVERLLQTDLFSEITGAGLYPALAAHARQVVGIDLAPAAVASACQRHPRLAAVPADARRLPFADDSFDAVVSPSTLDHFRTRRELVASLRELHRVLRPRGLLLLTLDNPANPLVGLRNALPFALLNRLGVVPYYVGATYGPGALQAVLRRIGFEIVEVRGVLHCPRAPAVALAGLLDRHGSPAAARAFLAACRACERAARWPTRHLTGYFTAVKAVKRCSP